MARHDQGYTLVELVVVMMIFSIVMTLICVSFNRIVASSGQLVKSAETDIGGLIGLELLRCDLELAGFGLFWSMPAAVNYDEAKAGVSVHGCPDGCPEADASLFNDGRPRLPNISRPPRAYVVGDNVGYHGSDYLVLKGTALGMSETSRSWSYLNYSSNGAVVKSSKSELELRPGKSERVIVIKSSVTGSGVASRELVTDGSDFSLPFNRPLPAQFEPKRKQDQYLVYGVARANQDKLVRPFNRADYYLTRADDTPVNCAPNTGLLNKRTLDQDGGFTSYPILDCVADLQVVFYMDTDQNGEIDYHPHIDDHEFTAADLREQLKEIRVYILAQQGKKNSGYFYPVDDPDKAIVVGDPKLAPSLGKVWSERELSENFGAGWRNYHWKVYTIVVQPKNL